MVFVRKVLNSLIVLALSSNTFSVYADVSDFSDFEESLADFYGDEEFISIATGNKVLIYKAPSVATVITAEQISDLGAKSVSEALENVPGLHVYPSPFNRLNNSFSIRGIHTDQNPQVLFLIDGLPIREEYTGARPQAFRLPVHAISRIEVIRGPGSAIYGADAYSGVINVITKDLTTIESEHFGGSYGSFNSTNFWYQNSLVIGEGKFGVAIETLKSNGDENRLLKRDLQSVFDDVLDTSASKAPAPLSTGYDILDLRVSGKIENFEANIWYWKNLAGVGAGAAQALDPTGKQETTIYQFDSKYDWKALSWEGTAQYRFYKMDDKAQFSVLPENSLLPLGADGNLNLINPVGLGLFTEGLRGSPQPSETLHSLDLTLLFSDINDHNIRIGAGLSQRKLTANEKKNFGPGVIDTIKLAELFALGKPMVIDGTLTDVSNTEYAFVKDIERINSYVNIQDQWQFSNDWELTSGIRYDYYDDFGSTFNPRLALVWEMSQNISTKLLYGKAFRAPAFDTLHAINNPVGIGNPNLDPETIDTVEFSLNKHMENHIRWSFNLFRYKSKNLIEFIQDSGTTSATAQNAKDQEGYGFEAELTWKNEHQSMDVNYSWQRSKNSNSNLTIPLAPKQLFSALYKIEISNDINLTAKLNWIGTRDRGAGDLREELSNYSVIDIAVHWHLGDSDEWKLSLVGKNILDENGYEPSHPLVADALGPIDDYIIQGRDFYLQVSKEL
jgi:iron complex outermembrane receptor protein